jgi:hypothetical protein
MKSKMLALAYSVITLAILPQLVVSRLAAGWLNVDVAHGTCTLKASGKDDAPAFALALASSKCQTVTIPKKTTLSCAAFLCCPHSGKALTSDSDCGCSIQSPLNTTKTYNKHIKLEGTITFNNNVVRARPHSLLRVLLKGLMLNLDVQSYWNSAAYRIAYQNSSNFWFLGGENILLDGGGVIQGNGQVRGLLAVQRFEPVLTISGRRGTRPLMSTPIFTVLSP